MISTSGISLSYGKRVIFKDVSIKFAPGNCYGLIGANGSGKSTFLKILAYELEPDHGEVSIGARERIGSPCCGRTTSPSTSTRSSTR